MENIQGFWHICRIIEVNLYSLICYILELCAVYLIVISLRKNRQNNNTAVDIHANEIKITILPNLYKYFEEDRNKRCLFT